MEVIKQMQIKNLKLIFIFWVLLILSFNLVSSEKTDVFIVHLKYLNGNITFENVSLVKMNYFLPSSAQEGRYLLEVRSFSDEKLFSEKFDFSLTISNENLYGESSEERSIFEDIEGGVILLNESSKELIVPYFSTAKRLYVYDYNQIISEYDVSEKYTSAEKENKTASGNYKLLIYLIIGFLIALIVFLIIYFIMKKKDVK